MDDHGKISVLIAGAGPTGLTLAVELARSGVPFRILDAAPGPRPGSRGKGVQPRTMEVFEDLGIADRVLATGRMAMPMVSTAPDGTVRRGGGVPPALAGRPDIPYAASLITPEWRVEEALRDRLEQLGGRVEFGAEVVGFEQRPDGVRVEVRVDGEPASIDARWLLGADGGHSIVRKTAGIPFLGETLEDVRVVLADLPVIGLDRDAWLIWPHPTGLMSLCPLPSTDLFQYAASVVQGEQPRLALDDLQRTVEERTGRTDIRLGEPVWTSVWRANVRLVERYRDGAVLLGGDAAHIHSPAGGQGMNTGIQDAHNLAWKLAAVERDGAPDALLDTYEAERRPIAAHVLALSNERLAQTLRTNDVPVRRDASTIQLDVGYRGSALARDDRDEAAALRAGDRAPDATELVTADGARRLFELIGGGRFTVLTFGSASVAGLRDLGASVLHVLPAADGSATSPDAVVDTGGHLAAAYGATDSTLVLIRPDGYVGVISDAGDPGAVADLLRSVAA